MSPTTTRCDGWPSSPPRWVSNQPDADTIATLLDLAGVAAHASQRTAAPIACYLVGQAGMDPSTALARAREV